jgi:arylsulfatase A-like enzyme
VIDSLRPDYISAYNPEATFTPAIGAFARESLVWRQAFTSYTGTALSQPALWAGGLIQRRMYIRPFSAVDNLERLVTAGGYRRYISMDAILNALLEDRSNLVPLDSHLAHPEKLEEMFKFDLCPTLHEIAADLDRDAHRTEPIFFYSQPQNLHVRVLGIKSPRYIETRKGGSRFFKPAVDALTRIDGCFGTFIDYLKARDLFANSIIILTSDHGDAYGEGGLWGHAFYMVPETVRIPLIMHVPEYLRRERYWDPEAVALLTDVTPTLYALSGYHLHAGDLLGRPLLTRDAAEAQAYRRDRYFLQSSYNLNFGLLDGHADWLYVANATASTETFFDLHDPQAGPRPLTKADRFKYRKWLLDWVERLNAYYLPKAVATD